MPASRRLTVAALTLTTVLLSQPTAWAAERETRPLGAPVSAVHLSGPIDVEIRQGELKDAEIEADATLRARVKIENQNGEVRISLEKEPGKGWFDWSSGVSGDIRVRLVLPSLNRVSIKGSGDIALGSFDLQQQELKGGGRIEYEARLAASIADQRDGAVNVLRGLRMESDVRSTRFGKVGNDAVHRLDH